MNVQGLDLETVERLLDGTAAGPDGQHPLAPLLSAVRAAPCPGELAGEAAALRAYRLARQGAPLAVPTARRWGVTLTGVGVRAALAGLLVASTGGVALAAVGGVLPNPLRPQSPPASSAPAVAPTGSPTDDAGTRSTPPSEATGRPDPDVSTVGLCRAYRAQAGDNPGRALDNPAFAGLVNAAGGRGQVPGYCEQVLATEPADRDPHATPTDRPGNQPNVGPTRRPSKPPAPTKPPGTPGGPDPATAGPAAERGKAPSNDR